jgi:ribosomal protein S18 acetylase RimI-like enzyme
MTRNKEWISPEAQLNWWNSLDLGRLNLFLAYVETEKRPIGYGLVRYLDSFSTITGALVKEWRGKGLGRQLFIHLLSLSAPTVPCRLEVLETNARARNLYESLRFEEIGRKDGIIEMERP